jgi:putative ABC transport system permease protein
MMAAAALQLALRSLWNRRATALLTVFAIGVSVALVLGVQTLRSAARNGFASTVSGVDLIVGARSGPVNLLLYTVFHVGDPTANVSWASYQKIAHHPDVEWTIPISIGDSHRGFRVIGTTPDYFRRYRFAGSHALEFAQGAPFLDLYEAVLGADVARQLGYRLGSPILVSHGLGSVSFLEHRDKPFRVSGILARTGTPVDRTVHVSLAAITAIHADWQSGVRAPPGARLSAADVRALDLTPASISAFMVGMRAQVMTLTMQRAINEYRGEPLLAIIPGVALAELWGLVSVADTALLIVAACVVLAGLLGMLAAILATLNERRREMAILRSVGARPHQVALLLVAEAGLLAAAGAALGLLFTYIALLAGKPLLEQRFGIFLRLGGLTRYDVALLAAVIAAAILLGLVPAWRAYRNTLSDGLTQRL